MDLLKGVPEQVVTNCDHLARFIKIVQCEVKMVAALAMAAECAITGYDAPVCRAGAKPECFVDYGRSQAAQSGAGNCVFHAGISGAVTSWVAGTSCKI